MEYFAGQMALSGLPIGFLAHYWYRYLDRYLPGKALRTIIKKTAMDISIGSFALNILWFGSKYALLEFVDMSKSIILVMLALFVVGT